MEWRSSTGYDDHFWTMNDVFSVSALVILLHHIPLFPPDWLDSYVQGWAWLGWTPMTPLFFSRIGTQQCEGSFVVCCTGSPSVSLCLSSHMCQSINDWCLPAGLDASFTCSLPHSCSVNSAPGPMQEHTALRRITWAPQEWCGFWKLHRLMYHTPLSQHDSSHIQYCSPCRVSTSAYLFLFRHRFVGDGSVQMLRYFSFLQFLSIKSVLLFNVPRHLLPFPREQK